jgi:hypothetical protein
MEKLISSDSRRLDAGAPISARGWRQNVGRVSHGVFAFGSRTTRDAARHRYSQSLGIDDWTDLGDLEQEGIHVIISRQWGIELLCPIGSPNILEDHLARHGEGLLYLVFGVDDLHESTAHAQKLGVQTILLPRAPERVFEYYAICRETILGDIGGIPLMLGEFCPHPPYAQAERDRAEQGQAPGLHHVSFIYADQASRDAARDRLRDVLGIEAWSGPVKLEDPGVEFVAAWDAGIVLLNPTHASNAASEYLARVGEGFYALAFGSAKLMEQAARTAGPSSDLCDWADRSRAILEIAITANLAQKAKSGDAA